MKTDEYTLGLALGSAALAAALLPLPMLGLLSMLLLPTALVLVIRFVVSSKAPSISPQRSLVGAVTLLLAAVFFFAALFSLVALLHNGATAVSSRSNVYAPPPDNITASWLWVAVRFLTAAFGWALGLHRWADWTRQRCAGWTLAVLILGAFTALILA
jgi:hypothetical protein